MQIKDFGLIEDCKKKFTICKYCCCEFTNNYIVLYPGELEKSKLNKNHLKIIDNNYYGGKKAICLRQCTKDDFKPLDCKSYPYFPKIDNKGKIHILKGKKCPLTEDSLINHGKKFLEIWKNLIKDREIYNWIKKVELIGYELVK